MQPLKSQASHKQPAGSFYFILFALLVLINEMLSSWETSSASFPLNRVCHQPVCLFLGQAAAACMHINGYYDTSSGVACQRGLRVRRA